MFNANQRGFGITLYLVLILALTVVLGGCANAGLGNTTESTTLQTTDPATVPDSRIDWTMYGYMVSPGEEPISTTDLSVSGTVTYGETGTDVLKLDIAFPQTARYRYDGPTAYYSQSRDIWGLGYFVCASYSYDSSANASVFSCFAVSLDKEYVIFNWEDGQDLYLVASTDPETDPHDILAYFQIFREKYAVDD